MLPQDASEGSGRCRTAGRAERAVPPAYWIYLSCCPSRAGTPASRPGISLELGPACPAGSGLGCRRQRPELSYAVVLLFNNPCEKSFSVGTVYIVNKID